MPDIHWLGSNAGVGLFRPGVPLGVGLPAAVSPSGGEAEAVLVIRSAPPVDLEDIVLTLPDRDDLPGPINSPGPIKDLPSQLRKMR